MVALTMIVLDELDASGAGGMRRRDDPAQTLVFDRSCETFGVGIGIGAWNGVCAMRTPEASSETACSSKR